MEHEIDLLLTLLADSYPNGCDGRVEDLFDRLLEEKAKQCKIHTV